MLKYMLVFACSLCCAHMATFRVIIVLSSVFCVLGADALLQLCLLFDSSCNDFLSNAHHCQATPYKLI